MRWDPQEPRDAYPATWQVELGISDDDLAEERLVAKDREFERLERDEARRGKADIAKVLELVKKAVALECPTRSKVDLARAKEIKWAAVRRQQRAVEGTCWWCGLTATPTPGTALCSACAMYVSRKRRYPSPADIDRRRDRLAERAAANSLAETPFPRH